MNKLKMSVMGAAMVLCMGVVAMPQQVQAQPTIDETVAWLNGWLPGANYVSWGHVKFDKKTNDLIFSGNKYEPPDSTFVLHVGLLRSISYTKFRLDKDRGRVEKVAINYVQILCEYPADPDDVHEKCEYENGFTTTGAAARFVRAIENIQSQVPRLIWKKDLF